MLSHSQRQQLLTLARQTIAATLDGKVPEVPVTTDPDLERPAGAFVTLTTEDGDLRGCIGSIEAREPLQKAVVSSAIAAATRDPRFPPVSKRELASLALEISVMGPLLDVRDPNEIEVGRDGLIISRGRYAGLLLPQVASEYGWDRKTFLEQTCAKAGLPRESWQQKDTRIQRFSAEVFSEKSLENQ